jgi:hypothetical protein
VDLNRTPVTGIAGIAHRFQSDRASWSSMRTASGALAGTLSWASRQTH